ncbi:MAG: DUF447 domain-containing protein [Gammaproteobacteria bacterium]|nr:MAG: DUF447 domain-containing protein [Gammaproteobacteria bacterium]
MINESIITTLNEDGSVHIAPMGVRREDDLFVVAPFKPSTTFNNLQRSGQAVINMTDDVRIFAGCLTGHYDWPTVDTSVIDGKRLEAALSHIEIEVAHQDGDDIRPVFYCSAKHQQTHAPFMGLNRAKAAVLEAAVLVSRLHMLPDEKINNEIEYLKIAIDKTASEHELEAWAWLIDRIKTFRQQNAKKEQGSSA